MFDELNNDDNIQDNSFFNMPEEEDFIADYESMMAELDNRDPMDIIPQLDETEFYEAIDGWDTYYYEEDLTGDIIKKGKRNYRNGKEEENEFKKEFKEELTMLYDLLEEANKFGKKLDKKYDSLDGSKAKGTSKYLNDLSELVLTSKTNKLQIIKEITNLKKTIQELKIKADGKKGNNDTSSTEGQANDFFSNIMSVGRNNFLSALNGDEPVSYEYSSDQDIEYLNALPDIQENIHDRINERLLNENFNRSADADNYIKYENLKPELVILFNPYDNTWEMIARDKDGQRIIDYPVPTKKDLGKMKFSQDGRFATDSFGRSYKCIEKCGGM